MESWLRSTKSGMGGNFMASLKRCGIALKSWSNKTFGHIPKSLKQIQSELKSTNSRRVDSTLKKLEKDRVKLLELDEYYWKQRAWSSLAKRRGSELQIFSCKASQRQSQNSIKGMEDNGGN
ncbi:hypothetical protein TorRG33x02_292570 [Trema orientale]|uniref:Uncharacterized protein n=1 Tax=Trema orientale TaxID=63057 RepID=A0A2P5CA75_TREOI|nr:hypothetical protein TorRG33x02_292570 [Trema orientale]